MAKRWKKSVDEGKEGKSLRRSETSRLWKKRTEEVKKEEAGLCVWEETSKMRNASFHPTVPNPSAFGFSHTGCSSRTVEFIHIFPMLAAFICCQESDT